VREDDIEPPGLGCLLQEGVGLGPPRSDSPRLVDAATRSSSHSATDVARLAFHDPRPRTSDATTPRRLTGLSRPSDERPGPAARCTQSVSCIALPPTQDQGDSKRVRNTDGAGHRSLPGDAARSRHCRCGLGPILRVDPPLVPDLVDSPEPGYRSSPWRSLFGPLSSKRSSRRSAPSHS